MYVKDTDKYNKEALSSTHIVDSKQIISKISKGFWKIGTKNYCLQI